MDPEINEALDAAPAADTTTSHNASILADMQEAMADIQSRGETSESPTPQVVAEPEVVEEVAADDVEIDDVDPEVAVETEETAAPNELQSTVERWSSVMEQVNLTPEQALDTHMSYIVALHQNPVQVLAELARNYVKPEQAQTLLAALANQHNVDPFDVDVDAYKQQQPVQQRDMQVQQLEAQVLSMQIEGMKNSGQFPLLTDVAVQSSMSALKAQMPGLSLQDAYTVAVSRDPSLSAKHKQAVDGKGEAKKPTAVDLDAARKQKLRRAKASDLPKGAQGSRAEPSTAQSIYDDVRQTAIELGFGVDG